jgi:flagellar hook-length control protein FliK
MNQMVLPQTPPSKEPGQSSKQPDQTKSGDSQFDEVSRNEEKRLARKQADRQDEASRQADRQDERRSETAAERSTSNERSARTDTASRNDAGGPDGAEEPASAQADDFTEAELAEQSVLFAFGLPQPLSADSMPLTANRMPTAGMGAMGEGANGMVKGMLMMALGKTGEPPGKTASLQFADLMPAQGGQELLRTPDPSALVSSQRLTAAPDLSLQQQAALNGRMPGEPVPLKGYTTSVDVPVGQAEWGDKVMGKLTWLTANKLSVAEIHLTPPDMGPMEVRVQVQQDQTSITVHAANPAVRDQLELHSHRLRDMLGEQGLNLEKFDVADSSQQQTGEQSASGDDSDTSGRSNTQSASVDEGLDTAETTSIDLTQNGEVDIFA